MSIEIIYTLGSVLLVSVVSLVGIITLSWNAKFLKVCISFFVALSIGALLGDAFIHLIPEALEHSESPDIVPLLVLAGFLLFFIIEKYFHWHHGMHTGEDHTDDHCDVHDPNCKHKGKRIKPLSQLILVSDSLHNLLDGLVIGAAYIISIEVGIATTIAVIMHEIPQEIGDFGVLIHSGLSKAKALLFNFLSALFSVLGAVFALLLGSSIESLIVFILPVAAGSFIYIASSDLTPELHKSKSVGTTLIQIMAIVIGIIAMWLLLFLD